MFSKSVFFLIVALVLAIIVLLSFFLIGRNPANKTTVNPPVPIFQRASPSPAPLDGQTNLQDSALKKQAEADIKVTDLQNRVYEQYPWYNSLPLQKNNYFVLFDLSKKEFRAKIYPQRSSTISIDDQVNSYKQEILTRLSQLGIDSSKYEIKWSVIPE